MAAASAHQTHEHSAPSAAVPPSSQRRPSLSTARAGAAPRLREYPSPRSARISAAPRRAYAPSKSRQPLTARPPRRSATVSAYTLRGGNRGRFILAAPDAMGEGDARGVLDTWPANASASPLARERPETSPAARSPASPPRSPTTSRPAFLVALEARVDKEASAACGSSGEARLQVYRECLDTLIANLHLYQPLLARVKHEYESVIEAQARRLRQLPELLAANATLQGEKDATVFAASRRAASEVRARDETISALRAELVDARRRAEEAEAEKSRVLSESKELQQQLLTSEEAKKTLYQALRRYENVRKYQEQVQYQEAVNAVTLSEKLARLQKQHEAVAAELAEERARALTMVPGEKHYALVEQYESAARDLAAQKAAYDSLTAEHRQLLLMYERDAQQRVGEGGQGRGDGTAAAQLAEWKRSLIARYLTADVDENAPIESIVEMLCEQIDLLKEKGRPREEAVSPSEGDKGRYFQGLGQDNSVPKYLRIDGRVRNRKMPKRELEALIRDVWAYKYRSEETRALPLGECLFRFLKKQFGIQSMIAEMGYNMLDALQRYQYDADCELFFNILQGNVPEEVYQDQLALLAQLQERLQKLDAAQHGGKRKGTVKAQQILSLVQELTPAKDELRFRALRRALFLDDQRSDVDYGKLFEEDAEANQSRFIECLREQHLEEIAEFASEIASAVRERDALNGGLLSVQSACDAVKGLDPAKPSAEIEQFVARGFGVNSFQALRPDQLTKSVDFVARVKPVLLKRSGPKPSSASEL